MNVDQMRSEQIGQFRKGKDTKVICLDENDLYIQCHSMGYFGGRPILMIGFVS
jgi:hypothetical protein